MDTDSGNDFQGTLQDLQLAPGTLLQAQPVREPARSFELQFLGLVGDKGVLVEPLGVAALKQGLRAGEAFQVSGFTGQYDVAFATTVVRVFDFTFREPPLAYALLAYPERISARRVRRAPRVRTQLPARIALPGGETTLDVVVRDISTAGALLQLAAAPGGIGAEVAVHLDIDFEGEPLAITLPATICRLDAGEAGIQVGVLFQDVLRADKLALHYLVSSLAGRD
jgi:hypothetical protein